MNLQLAPAKTRNGNELHRRSSSGQLTRSTLTKSAPKLVLVLVGLPARGKSFISAKVQSYFAWRGEKVRVFNVGNFRRHVINGRQDAQWFTNTAERDRLAELVMDHMLSWLQEGGAVAIFDATNTTRRRREFLQERVSAFSSTLSMAVAVVFIESICNDQRVLQRNYDQKVRYSPDYAGMTYENAVLDLKSRIENYKKVYESITDDEHCSYVRLFNLQSKVHANHIYGRLAKSLLPYLMSIHIGNRPIWLARAGHCVEAGTSLGDMDNIPCVASRSANLSAQGEDFARRLAFWVQRREEELSLLEDSQEVDDTSCGGIKCSVFTSTLPRALQTAQFITSPVIQLSALNPLDKGEAYGISVDEMKEKMPESWIAWEEDPLNCRFPGGESYHDLMTRLEPVVTDIEQQTDPVLVVSHISALQVLFAYFVGHPISECFTLSIPFHSVIEFVPDGKAGWEVKKIDLQH